MDEYLLDVDELAPEKLYDADKSMRVINYIVDNIIIWLGYIALFFVIGVILGVSSGVTDEAVVGITQYATVIYIAWMVAYYTICETVLKGRTVAKFITKTRAVTQDGLLMTPAQALGRSLCRLIPFDALSFLFGSRGWHDSISSTRVVEWKNK